MMESKTLVCVDCGTPFEFTTGEQSFFWSKGLTQPRRCKVCREKRKATLVPEVRNG